jgi:RNA polymerase sigma-70 factor (ECF subfamily)
MSDSAGQASPSQTDGADPARHTDADPSAALAVHSQWLRTVLAARGVDRADLDEVMQEVAAAALSGAGQLRDPRKTAPWLYRIAITQALLYRRRVGRRRRLIERYADTGAATAEAVDDDPLAWLLAEEQQQFVRQAIAMLPRRDAEILLLKYSEDWTYRQLAEHMGVSPSAVEARLHRARGRLRSALGRLAPELVTRR